MLHISLANQFIGFILNKPGIKNITLVFITIHLLIGCEKRVPEIKHTVGQQKEWVIEYINKSMSEISLTQSGKVHFVRTNFNPKFKMPEHLKEFDLSAGETFSHPDDHGGTTFLVKEIRKSGVILEYKSTFDHRSFGKKVITIDEGQIDVSYKK